MHSFISALWLNTLIRTIFSLIQPRTKKKEKSF